MTRDYCMPSWQRWTAQLHATGCPVISVDSDGFIEELIPLWVEPASTCASRSRWRPSTTSSRFGTLWRSHGLPGGVDKRAMAKGGQAIRDELRRIEPVVSGGGFIPGCDHGVPADVSWPCYLDYCASWPG